MENLIRTSELEELLVAKWAHFVDARKLIAFVVACVRDAHLPHCEDVGDFENFAKSVRISISRFEWVQDGFLIWADFSIPSGRHEVATGTTELLMTLAGTNHVKTIGTRYARKN